jgi:hypothetical protein
MTRTTQRSASEELASRTSDGVEVALLWHTDTDVLSVAVVDSKTGDSFELTLGDADRALDVFHHPYAYAAHRGVDLRLPSREPELAAAA